MASSTDMSSAMMGTGEGLGLHLRGLGVLGGLGWLGGSGVLGGLGRCSWLAAPLRGSQ